MEGFLTFTAQSQGRDRLFRATQYGCAVCVYLLRNRPESGELVERLESLQSNMRAGRKLFRLGNTANSLEAVRGSLRLSDRVLCLCLTAANLSRAVYFLCDNFLWARNVGLVRSINKERWSLNSSRFYLLSLVMSLSRDFYELLRLMSQKANNKRFRQKMNQHLSEGPEVAEAVIPQLDAFLFLLMETLRSHPAVALDTLKNLCDLVIPLDRLGFYRFNAGLVGFCGLLSSLIGILTLAKPTLKIKP